MKVTRVMFKSEDSLWEMVATGQKHWEARVDDASDLRIRALHDTPKDDLQVGLWNKATSKVIWLSVNTIYKYSQFGNWLFMEIIPMVSSAQPVDLDPGPTLYE